MSVGHEAGAAAALQTRFGKKPGRRRNRKNLDRRVRLQQMRKINRGSIEKDEIDFRMRHATRLDRVFDRGFLVSLPNDFAFVASWPNEKRQIAVKEKVQGKSLRAAGGLHRFNIPR
jgi:hypothetical protein